MTASLEETLEDLCDEISLILSSSSLKEAYINKPGNASRKKDIKTVSYLELQESASYLSQTYKKVCMMGYLGKDKPIFSVLRPEKFRNALGGEFALFGSALLLLPIAFVSTQVSDVSEMRSKLSQFIMTLDVNEGKEFIRALRYMNPSYKGKIDGEMDIEKMANNTSLYDILVFSSDFDEVARNMVNGYYLTFIGYNYLIEKKCETFEQNVRRAFLKILSYQPDTLIMKKYGAYVSLKISKMASKIADCPTCGDIENLDRYMTDAGFNPGSTADIIASSIALYDLERWYRNKISSGIWLPLPKGCNRAGK